MTLPELTRRELGEGALILVLGAALGYLWGTEVALYMHGTNLDLARLAGIRQLEPILAKRPPLWLGLVAGAAAGALALALVPGPELRDRLVRLRRVLGWALIAGGVAAVLMFLSPYARFAAALFLAGLVALPAAALAARTERRDSRRIDRVLVWGAFLAVAAVYFLFSYTRHENFGSGSWDLGAYNHNVWLASRFKPMMSTVLGDAHIIGTHWIPIVYVLAPVFWVSDSSAALLVVQALLAASTVFPLFWLARRQGLGRFFGLALAVSFLLSYGVQSAINFDFHETTIALSFFAFAFYFLETGRARWAAPFLVLLFLCKEGMPLYIAFLGLYVALFHRRWVLGSGLFVFGFVAFLVILEWIMPALLVSSHSNWDPQELMKYQDFGVSYHQALVRVISDPVRTLAVALTPAVKVESLLLTYGTFAFLALFAPRFLLLAIPLVAERFLTTKQTLWGMGFHYGGPLALVAAIGSIYGAAWLREPLARGWQRLAGWRPAPPAVAGFLGLLCLGTTSLLDGWGAPQPAEFASLDKPYFSKRPDINRRALAMIPPDASVAAQNHFVPHLAMREKIWLLHRPIRAEYVVMNPDEGPWPFDRGYHIALLKELLSQGYRPIISEGMTVVLRKHGATAVPLAPELRALLGLPR